MWCMCVCFSCRERVSLTIVNFYKWILMFIRKKKDNDLQLFIVNIFGLRRQNMHEVQLLLVLSY